SLVTGASRGIGRAVARSAADRGSQVGLIARGQTDLKQVLDEIGGRGALAAADVASRPEAEAAVAAVERQLGPIDIVVANAGIGLYGPFFEADPEDFARLLGVNVLGTMHVLRSALPGMVQRRRGHVVIVGSVAGRLGTPFEAVYSASKFAQVGLAEALSVELSAFGIGVSLVNPGPVDTAFFDRRGHAYMRSFPRKVSAQRVAKAVMAAVDRRRFEQLVPRWLRPAQIFRHLAPPLYLSGTRRSFRAELSELAAPDHRRAPAE
ncbi:MAG TPA: SDR family NAD(P)-dependent oxidoreductase, partial [Acidimicrobiales bacterium]|nr:SDR family NAD(P)-dependent oxidoreductase [Acidimicrobiales bacterium]